MMAETNHKVKASHLRRSAYLYIRQSTMRQVRENTESTERQYALRERAIALGWPEEKVILIDKDQARSGASSVDREGFQELVKEVGMGRAGIVMGLELARLSRSSSDWSRLIEICGLTETLILDEEGTYDPNQFNDRLLLGLKSTMGEAELHVMRMRLLGGMLNKAARGELKTLLPVGLVYTQENEVVLDPDKQVQESIRMFFQTFRRTGSATSTVKAFRKQGMKFPHRLKEGPHKGDLVWRELRHSKALNTLHNPRYAGAFSYGRTKGCKRPDGSRHCKKLPRGEWHTLLPGAHDGYVSWEEFEANQRRLSENAQAHGSDRRKSPPREGPAMLQGLAICGLCGNPMTVRYRERKGRLLPIYLCQREGIEHAKRLCQSIPGTCIDEAIGELLAQSVTPLNLELALSVQKELQGRVEEADRLRKKQVERARYDAQMAQRRFMQVNPDNRFVADSLEAEWNEKLRALDEAQREYERRCTAENTMISEKQRAEILSLATNFPKLWQDPRTPNRERKRVVRLIVEDVTLIKGGELSVHVRFKGGATKSLMLPRPLRSWESWQTNPEVIAEIDRLLDHYTEGQIASMLNNRGLRSGKGLPFQTRHVARIRREYKLKSRYHRLRDRGLLSVQKVAKLLGVSKSTVVIWGNKDLLRAHTFNDKGECLYEHPGDNRPAKMPGKKFSSRRRFSELPSFPSKRGAT